MVKNLPAVQETWIQSLGQEDPLEKGSLESGIFCKTYREDVCFHTWQGREGVVEKVRGNFYKLRASRDRTTNIQCCRSCLDSDSNKSTVKGSFLNN